MDKFDPSPRRLRLRSCHRVYDDRGRIVMGEGRLALLDAITVTGSINQAAKQLGMSYKSAWSKIRSTESHLGTQIVCTDKATGSRLTAEGLALLERYRRLKRRCLKADDGIFDMIFGKKQTD